MRRLIWATALVLGGVACEDDPRPTLPSWTDSESHWLQPCETEPECGPLSCVCGVCTLPCEGAAACEGLVTAVCAPIEACAAEAVCAPACQADADCGDPARLGCVEGACLPRAVPDAGPAPDAALDAGAPDLAVPDMATPDMLPPAPGPVDRYPCPVDGCCEHADCPAVDGRAGVCAAADVDAQNARCGPPDVANVCVAPQCDADADCGAGKACVGADEGFSIATCVVARCRVDADCVAREGGECTAFLTPCWNAGFACTYADDPCREDADCPVRETPKVCQPQVDGRTICADAPAP